MGDCTVAVGLREVRFQFEGLVIVLDGRIVLALVIVGVAAVVIGLCVIGLQLEGLVKVLDGRIVLALDG